MIRSATLRSIGLHYRLVEGGRALLWGRYIGRVVLLLSQFTTFSSPERYPNCQGKGWKVVPLSALVENWRDGDLSRAHLSSEGFFLS